MESALDAVIDKRGEVLPRGGADRDRCATRWPLCRITVRDHGPGLTAEERQATDRFLAQRRERRHSRIRARPRHRERPARDGRRGNSPWPRRRAAGSPSRSCSTTERRVRALARRLGRRSARDHAPGGADRVQSSRERVDGCGVRDRQRRVDRRYYDYGSHLAEELSASLDIRDGCEETAGSVDNLLRVSSGEALIGFAQGDAAADAVAGTGAFDAPLRCRTSLGSTTNTCRSWCGETPRSTTSAISPAARSRSARRTPG